MSGRISARACGGVGRCSRAAPHTTAGHACAHSITDQPLATAILPRDDGMHAQRCALEAHPPPARIVTPRASARARADRGMRQHAGPAERCEGRHTSGSCLPIESCVSSFEQLSVPATQPDALRQQRPPSRALPLQLPGRCDITLPLRAPRVRCSDPAASPFTKPTTWPSSSRTMKYGPASFMLACSHARRHATLSVQRRAHTKTLATAAQRRSDAARAAPAAETAWQFPRASRPRPPGTTRPRPRRPAHSAPAPRGRACS